ncbi:MAG: MBOAT family protein [Lachnospiraceae bacterium]|nr:MBOAT family protein [Lachnospiraceae bacterium]
MQKTLKYRKALFFIAVLSIALPLLAIKEAKFTADIILRRSIPEWWFIPVGIAFYSMQLLSYISDVYLRKTEPEHNFLKFLLFSSFFPQIIQGPIPRYSELSHQLTEGHRFDERKLVKGFMLILWGFFLKLCIADKAGIIVDTVFDNFPAYQGMYVMIAGILYSLQLYADFSACSTLALGISALFGIALSDNFKHPYLASSVKDFWRRWHISLSMWLRDYIYIPLGGSKNGIFRKYINILLTFTVSGIWHGGGFKFLFWGLLHGLYQIAGDLLKPLRNRIGGRQFFIRFGAFRRLAGSIFTFLLVMLAWIIFRAETLKTGIKMIMTIFTVHNFWILTDESLFALGLNWKECLVLVLCLLLLLAVSLVQETYLQKGSKPCIAESRRGEMLRPQADSVSYSPKSSTADEKGMDIRDRILEFNILIRWAIYIAAILFILIFGTYGYGFDSQAFIYGRF